MVDCCETLVVETAASEVIVAENLSDQVLIVENVGLQGEKGDNFVEVVSQTALGGGRVIGFYNQTYLYMDSTNILHLNTILGVSVHACQANSPLSIQTLGLFTEPSWGWLTNLPIFLSTEGLLTQTPPTSGFSVIIATAVSPTTIFIKPCQGYLLI